MKKTISLLLALVMVFSLTGCAMSDYKEAVSLMESKSYAEAIEILESLDNYKDSAELIAECHYLTAAELAENKSYTEAIEILESLGDYKDSAELIAECRYQIAMELIEAQNLSEAAEILKTIADHKDAAEKLCSCNYQLAMELIDKRDYAQAEPLLREVGDYEDAEELAEQCSKAFSPEATTQKIMDAINNDPDLTITCRILEDEKEDCFYDVYINNNYSGVLAYYRIDENEDLQDEGIINYVMYLNFIYDTDSSDMVKLKTLIYKLISAAMMRALDPSISDLNTALNVVDPHLSNALDNTVSTYRYSGIYYSVSFLPDDEDLGCGFRASTAPLG